MQPLSIRESKRQWAWRNPDAVREANKRWRAANEAKVRRQARLRMQRFRAKLRRLKPTAATPSRHTGTAEPYL